MTKPAVAGETPRTFLQTCNVVGSVALRRSGTTILVATQRGYGKRSETGEYRLSHRGGKGVITVRTTEKTGSMVCIREVVDSDDIVIATSGGKAIRQHASEIRVAGRNTQGVRLIKLGEGDIVADVAAVVSDESAIAGIAPVAQETPPAAETPPAVKSQPATDLFTPPAAEPPEEKPKRRGRPAKQKPAGKTAKRRGSGRRKKGG